MIIQISDKDSTREVIAHHHSDGRIFAQGKSINDFLSSLVGEIVTIRIGRTMRERLLCYDGNTFSYPENTSQTYISQLRQSDLNGEEIVEDMKAFIKYYKTTGKEVHDMIMAMQNI
ncbi:MAG: hypothetical protein PF440_03050 [Thiomicrorhabdus sp.]|nr:hypothetical protein [Thiomicrorhabdus sp.]